jgi:hypothetical protein
MVRVRWISGAVGAALALSVAVGVAGATTGPNGTSTPKVLVPATIGNQFTGRFVVTRVDRHAKIHDGQISIDYTHTATPYLFGSVQLGSYDADGRQSTLVANLYPFAYRKGKLHAAIYIPGSKKTVGSFTFKRPANPDLQSGTVAWHGGPYAIAYQRAGVGVGAAPPAKQVSAVAAVAPPKLRKDGLGPKNAAYYGRYLLQVGAARDAAADAGPYAPVVRLASALTSRSARPDSGSLTLFGNLVKKGAPLVPAGIMTLHTPTSTDVAYLTDWKWGGNRRTAVVRGGSTDGPEVGSFVGTVSGTSRISGTLTVGKQHTAVSFKRTS